MVIYAIFPGSRSFPAFEISSLRLLHLSRSNYGLQVSLSRIALLRGGTAGLWLRGTCLRSLRCAARRQRIAALLLDLLDDARVLLEIRFLCLACDSHRCIPHQLII